MKNEIGNSDSNNILTSGSSEEHDNEISFFSRQVWKKALKYLIPLVIVVVVAGSLIYNYVKMLNITDLQREQEFAINLQAKILDDDIDNIIAELLYLVTLDDSDNLWENSGGYRPEVLQRIEESIITKMDISQMYAKATILDIEGNEILRLDRQAEGAVVKSDSELQQKKDRHYFNKALALEPGQIYVADMDIQVEYGDVVQPERPVIRFIKALRDSRGETKGMLVLYYDADLILKRIRSTESEEQNMILLNSEGYWLYGTESDKKWGFVYPERETETFEKYHSEVWREILSKDQGSLVTSEGSFVFKKVYLFEKFDFNYVIDNGTYSWILVSLVPNDILAATNLESLLIISGTAIFILILIIAIIILNIRSRYMLNAKNDILANNNTLIKKLYSKLKINEERLSFAIEGAGDGIWDWDIKTGEVKFSKLYMEMLGYEENELPSHVNTWIESVHPEDYPQAEKNKRTILKNVFLNMS